MTTFEKKDMTGYVAVVTGATSGIGQSVAYRLCQMGMNVFGVGRNPDKLKRLQSGVRIGTDGRLFTTICDMRVESEVVDLFQRVKQTFGTLHVLVNTAGAGTITKASECETEHWRNMFEMNVISVGVATREALKVMEAGDVDGFIINIGGTSGKGLPPILGKYVFCASKQALRIITEGIRIELAEKKSKIKISMISSGCVDTELTKQEGWVEKRLDEITPRLEPEEVTDTVVFLLEVSRSVQIPEIVIRPSGEKL